MNREIKFRGKRLENGNPTDEWVYGSLICYYGGIDNSSIFKHDSDPELYSVGIVACEIFVPKTLTTYAVKSDTVGQYTGLLDCNGREIYEGDIILQRVSCGEESMEVKFEKGCFMTGIHSGSSTRRTPMLIRSKCKIIGNIHDNPELNIRKVKGRIERNTLNGTGDNR